MKKVLFLLLCFSLVVAGLGWMGYRNSQSSSLRSATLDEVGLVWHECQVFGAFERNQAAECFGQPMPLPLWNSTDKANLGEQVGMEDWRLTIGSGTYQTVVSYSISPISPCYTLYQDGTRLHTLCGEFTSHSPNISLQNIGGKAAWEFADHQLDTIIYDGQDVRQMYGLRGAYRPYGLDNKLIFVGKQDEKYFVVYNGSRVGPDFDEIVIAYCCEPVLWSVQYGQGKYLFWGNRMGQSYVVEIERRLSD
jgi:hypothetical protein